MMRWWGVLRSYLLFYNHDRLHSSLNYASWVTYEQRLVQVPVFGGRFRLAGGVYAPSARPPLARFVGTTHGNRRGAPSRIRVGGLSSIPAMACASRNRAGVLVIAGYCYIRRVRFSCRARVPNVVAHHSRHVGLFRSLCCGGGLCIGRFYAAPRCLSSRSSRSSAGLRPVSRRADQVCSLGVRSRLLGEAMLGATHGLPAPYLRS